jgi:hypothetical protein
MPEKDFPLTIICKQKESTYLTQELKRIGADFKIVKEEAFAPAPEVAITFLIDFSSSMITTIAIELWRHKKAYVDFETRHRLARRMLEDLEPLFQVNGKDTPKYSYYEFKTSKCKHYWEMDNGKISHGPLR